MKSNRQKLSNFFIITFSIMSGCVAVGTPTHANTLSEAIKVFEIVEKDRDVSTNSILVSEEYAVVNFYKICERYVLRGKPCSNNPTDFHKIFMKKNGKWKEIKEGLNSPDEFNNKGWNSRYKRLIDVGIPDEIAKQFASTNDLTWKCNTKRNRVFFACTH